MTEPAEIIDPDLAALLLAAARELVAASRARPRDADRITAARDELARLQALANE